MRSLCRFREQYLFFLIGRAVDPELWVNCIPANIRDGVTVLNEYSGETVTGTLSTFDVVGCAGKYSDSGRIVLNNYNMLSYANSTLTITVPGKFYVAAVATVNNYDWVTSGLTQVGTSTNTPACFTGENSATIYLSGNSYITVWR